MFVELTVVFTEAAANNLVKPALIFAHHANGDPTGFCFWVAVDTRADAGEGDRTHAILQRQLERVSVASGEQCRFPFVPTVPDRPHGMNDPLRG